MITASQLRAVELEYLNGVQAVIYENLDRIWGIRWCKRPFRGIKLQELPPALQRDYESAAEASGAIAFYYRTRLKFSRQIPAANPAAL